MTAPDVEAALREAIAREVHARWKVGYDSGFKCGVGRLDGHAAKSFEQCHQPPFYEAADRALAASRTAETGEPEECHRCGSLSDYLELASTDEDFDGAHPHMAMHPGGFCLVCGNLAPHPFHAETGEPEHETWCDSRDLALCTRCSVHKDWAYNGVTGLPTQCRPDEGKPDHDWLPKPCSCGPNDQRKCTRRAAPPATTETGPSE